MIAIASAAENNGIGKNNELLFRIPEDMRFFKNTTLGKTVVMGRATFLSLPGAKPLPGRANIVLTRDKGFAAEGVTAVRSVPELLAAVRGLPPDEVFVIGGADVYRQLLPLCDTVLLTKVFASPDADVFFPDVSSMPEWKLTQESPPGSYGELRYVFQTYRKKV